MTTPFGTTLSIHTDAEQGVGLDPARLGGTGHVTDIGLLRHGTSEGRASVALVVTLGDGTQVLAETTWRLLHNAVRALAQSPIGREETQD